MEVKTNRATQPLGDTAIFRPLALSPSPRLTFVGDNSMTIRNILTVDRTKTGSPDMSTYMQQTLRLTRHYLTSYYKSWGQQGLFQEVQAFCLFIGHARSGHSIVGALLDAHPEIVLPDEVDSLRYAAAGFSKEQICHILLARSQQQAAKGRTKQGRERRYSYRVPDQWQGRYRQLRVMGCSKAGKTTQRLARDPTLLEQFQNMIAPVQVKLIHVIRNPYDNISTFMLRGGRSWQNATENYFLNCKTLAGLQKQVNPSHWLLVRQEELIVQAHRVLNEMCQFLGVTATEEYLDSCASILYKTPAQSRHKIPWTPEWIEAVETQMAPFAFLDGYSYED